MESKICKFYTGKSIFITGATGFLGKTLVEKLLRSCDGIEKIYILIRQRKGKTVEQRFEQYISDQIFAFYNLKESGVCMKIKPIFGDTSLPELGISAEDKQILINNVNIVIHLAAIVKLNEPLRYAIEKNLKPMQSVIELCHQIKRFDCILYASTIALLNCTESTEESINHNIAVTPEFVINACDRCSDQQLNKLKDYFFYQYNNTYCISKALAEQLLARESDRLKIAIIRPSIILASYSEPVAGWVQGMQTATSCGILMGLGVIRVIPMIDNGGQCIIPVDFVANAVIAAIWAVSTQEASNLQVFHLTTKLNQSPNLRPLLKMFIKSVMKYPSKRVMRPTNSLIYTKTKLEFLMKAYVKHWMFAYFIDLIGKLSGFKSKVIRITTQMNVSLKDMRIFMQTSPDFQIDNTLALIEKMSESDRKLFPFDIYDIDWKMYCENWWLGTRRYILKERDEEIAQARKIYKWVSFKFHVLNVIWLSFLSILIYLVFYLIFDLIDFDFFLPSVSTLVNPTTGLDFIRILILFLSVIIGYKVLDIILL